MSLNRFKSCTLLSESLDVLRRATYQLNRNAYDNRDMLRLRERDMFEEVFPEQYCNDIRQLLITKPRYVYAGFDPTASSLHVGNLLVLKNLIHWQRSGHNVIALIGTATALIGDPSGRIDDREKQSRDMIREQGLQIQKNIETVFKNHEIHFWSKRKDASPLPPVKFVYNMDWFKDINVIDFLNNIGRHFRMGQMLLKDSVKRRVESESGMCFPEFTYQIFQAYDWFHLYKEYDCKFQIGGKDQMGNIEAGHKLIRRLLDEPCYAFTLPLVTNRAGEKFGKSAHDAVWLDKQLTTPFEFYQFFKRLPDADVYKLIKYFSFRPYLEIDTMIAKHKEAPQTRLLQTALADEMTVWIHGEEGLEDARRTTAALYDTNIEALGKLNPNDLKAVLKGCQVVECEFKPGYTIMDLTLDMRCFRTKQEALRIINAGGLHINYNRARNPEEIITQSVHILPNKFTHLRVGKKNCYMIKWIFESV